MVEEKCALPHDRLMLEEDRWDEFCGDSAWLAEGRGGGVPGIAASMRPLLAALFPWSGTCAACWRGMPGAWEGGQHLVPLCYFRNQLLGQ